MGSRKSSNGVLGRMPAFAQSWLSWAVPLHTSCVHVVEDDSDPGMECEKMDSEVSMRTNEELSTLRVIDPAIRGLRRLGPEDVPQ